MRNNVPDGDKSALVPPAGVEERAGGPTGRVLIEQLRASIRALEQVPVSLAIPPAPGAAPSRPACSLTPPRAPDIPSAPSPLEPLHQGGSHEIKPHAYRDTPAGLAFALSVIAEIQRQGPGLVLWCMTGFKPANGGGLMVLVFSKQGSTRRVSRRRDAQRQEAAWALEEGLKSTALDRSSGPNRDQNPAYGPAPRPCRPRRRNAVLPPHRPWRGKSPRHAHALADCHGGKRPYPFRYGRQLRRRRPRPRLLAPLPRRRSSGPAQTALKVGNAR